MMQFHFNLQKRNYVSHFFYFSNYIYTFVLISKKQDLQTEKDSYNTRIVLQSREMLFFCYYKEKVVKTIIFICCHSISLTEQPNA